MRLAIVFAIACVISVHAAAQDANPIAPYETHDAIHAAIDKACINNIMDELKEAKGFAGLEYNRPNQWGSILNGVVFTSYRDVNFESDYGDTRGDILCVAVTSQNLIAEIAFEFDGLGFPGLRTLPGRAPEENKITSFVSQNPSSITGTE